MWIWPKQRPCASYALKVLSLPNATRKRAQTSAYSLFLINTQLNWKCWNNEFFSLFKNFYFFEEKRLNSIVLVKKSSLSCFYLDIKNGLQSVCWPLVYEVNTVSIISMQTRQFIFSHEFSDLREWCRLQGQIMTNHFF